MSHYENLKIASEMGKMAAEKLARPIERTMQIVRAMGRPAQGPSTWNAHGHPATADLPDTLAIKKYREERGGVGPYRGQRGAFTTYDDPLERRAGRAASAHAEAAELNAMRTPGTPIRTQALLHELAVRARHDIAGDKRGLRSLIPEMDAMDSLRALGDLSRADPAKQQAIIDQYRTRQSRSAPVGPALELR